MVSGDKDSRAAAYRYYAKSRITVPHWPLMVLIVSFFYCLPLGRFSIGGFDSDFRIFDFAIVFVFGYYLTREQVMQEINRIIHSKVWFTRWLKVLIILLLLSLLVATAYSGTDFILPRLIRIFRFLSYLSVPFLVLAVVRTRAQYMALFNVLFWAIATVGVIAFLQGLNLLPNFWPEYWREMYSENDAPIATLSPHHKHMGVIMLVGLCLGVGYFLRVKPWWLKLAIAGLILMMFTVPLFAGTRTYLLGFVGVIPAMLYIGRFNLILPMMVLVGGGLLFLQFGGGAVSSKVEDKFEERVTARVDKLGYEGLYRERTVIYWDILRTLGEHPYLLLTGTGFQNIFEFIGANGAHNNYMQALMELGLLGLIVFLSFLALLWRNLLATAKIRDRDISPMAQYTWVALCGIIMTMFVGETFWGQAAMFTLAGQLSFMFALAVSPLYWLTRYQMQIVQRNKATQKR